MKCTVLFASPRGGESNTYALLQHVLPALRQNGCQVEQYDLYDLSVAPCRACRGCQADWQQPACVIHDDMDTIFESVLASDLILLATPIYAWSCTAPMKAALDRLVYALNKYYGDEPGPSLWQGKKLAIVTSCGYPVEKGADLFEEAVRRYCKHSRLQYLGMLAERHRNYRHAFMDEEKAARARTFGEALAAQL